ncbi:hypothetical protein KAJ26_05610 [bacterium]|nr:hypothetical protein [bacterium]
MKDREELDRILTLLAEKLELEDLGVYIIFVIGGSALLYKGLSSRPTKDVDIIAFGKMKENTLTLTSAKPFPEELKKISGEIAEDLGLVADWLNPGPTDLLEFGLPEDFVQRCEKKEYGKNLTVYFIDRYDQIHFKLYAAADQGPGRHLQDLLDLNPEKEEISSASKWTIRQDPSEGFKKVLKEMLCELGYEDVAERI